MDLEKLKHKPILPTLDEMYTRMHKEFKALRSCNMSKRDLVCYIKLKEAKSESTKILSFWEGVQMLLSDANDCNPFRELSYFTNFSKFSAKSIKKEERKYLRTL